MSHGILGMGKYGVASLIGSCAFFAYLSKGYMWVDKPKYKFDREFVEAVAKYQPALDVDYYSGNKR